MSGQEDLANQKYKQKNMSYQKRQLNAEEENVILPILVKVLKKTSHMKSLKAPEICAGMNNLRIRDGKFKQVFTESMLRRLSNYIRANEILPLIANNKGYYVSYDVRDIEDEIKSLEDRISGIQYAISGLKRYRQQLISEQINQDPCGIS